MRPWSFLLVPFLAVGCGSSATTPDASTGDDAGTLDAADGSADAPSSDAPGDAVVPPADAGDAATVTPPVACGQTFCRADQTCTAGKCAFSCVGFNVPGDYATVQAAIDGLATAGNDATICLAEKTYAEGPFYVRDPVNHGKALRIVGPSMDRAKITGHLYWQGGWKELTLQGLHLEGASNAVAIEADFATHPGKISLLASRFSGQTGAQIGDNYGKLGELFADGCDFAVGAGYAVDAFTISPSTFKVTVQNSYFHACGCATQVGASGQGSVDLRFVDNTVVGCEVGLSIDEASPNVTGLYANNVFTGMATVGVRRINTGTKVTHTNNALWANAANYQGTADGTGYVKSDCLLDTTGPAPTLKQGSPCRGAGDPTSAPPADFYGIARGTPADIGATRAY